MELSGKGSCETAGTDAYILRAFMHAGVCVCVCVGMWVCVWVCVWGGGHIWREAGMCLLRQWDVT